MNLKLIAVLVVAILIAHAVLIHLLIRTSTLTESVRHKEQVHSDKQFVPPAQPQAPQKTQTAEKPAVQPQQKPQWVPVLVEDRKPAAKNYTWRPLNYSKAVKGNIKSIQASAGAASGILVNLNTRQVLWVKNGSKSCPIASMSKLMTILLAYEKAMDTQRYPDGLQTKIKVVKAVESISPSKVYLAAGEVFTVKDLLLAASIKSANDAAGMLAIFFGNGKMENFVQQMNQKARELGMKNTNFTNPHGLPSKQKNMDNRSSAEDMVRLCEAFIQYDDLGKWSSIRKLPFRAPGQKNHHIMWNHNNLLPGARFGTKGVTGLKTGFTNRAGFCLAVTCTRNGETLLGVMTGFKSLKERDAFAKALLNWGYRRSAALNKKN